MQTNTGNVPLDTRLSVSQVEKYYGKLCALDAIDLHINAGEFVALLGPNGAGKSTLFHLLSGLFLPDAGTIDIDGKNLTSKPIYALARLGIVFQQITLDLDLSVRRNLFFHCDLHGLENIDNKIQDSLSRSGLLDSSNIPCRSLSGGNRRKVELARSLLHKPSILLMDEATVGLDPASRHALVAQVKRLCRDEGLSVLWATHLVDEVSDADRVYILDSGKVLQHGTPQEIIENTGTQNLLESFLALTGKADAKAH